MREDRYSFGANLHSADVGAAVSTLAKRREQMPPRTIVVINYPFRVPNQAGTDQANESWDQGQQQNIAVAKIHEEHGTGNDARQRQRGL